MRSAHMIDDYARFEKYFGSKARAISSFRPNLEDEKTHLFAVSLSSLFNLAAWTDGLQNERGHQLNVLGGFIDTMLPNAVAEWDGQNFYVGINNALFVTITEFAMFCFAQKNFFPDVGDAQLEQSPQPLHGYAPGLWLIQHTTSGKSVTDEHSAHLIPNCPNRYIQSIYLAQLMTRFVWLHELAHCNNGHVGFISHEKIANKIHELDDGLQAAQLSQRGGRKNLKLMKLLEYDADGSALKASLRIQTDSLENIEGIAQQSLDMRIDLALFAAYAMTWLFEEIQAYLNAKAGLTHPSPFDRLQNMFRVSLEHLHEQIPEIEGRRKRAFMRFDTVRDAIPNIFCTQNIQAIINDPDALLEASRLDADLEDVRRRLLPFSFFSST